MIILNPIETNIFFWKGHFLGGSPSNSKTFYHPPVGIRGCLAQWLSSGPFPASSFRFADHVTSLFGPGDDADVPPRPPPDGPSGLGPSRSSGGAGDVGDDIPEIFV